MILLPLAVDSNFGSSWRDLRSRRSSRPRESSSPISPSNKRCWAPKKTLATPCPPTEDANSVKYILVQSSIQCTNLPLHKRYTRCFDTRGCRTVRIPDPVLRKVPLPSVLDCKSLPCACNDFRPAMTTAETTDRGHWKSFSDPATSRPRC